LLFTLFNTPNASLQWLCKPGRSIVDRNVFRENWTGGRRWDCPCPRHAAVLIVGLRGSLLWVSSIVSPTKCVVDTFLNRPFKIKKWCCQRDITPECYDACGNNRFWHRAIVYCFGLTCHGGISPGRIEFQKVLSVGQRGAIAIAQTAKQLNILNC
jgi:hypothetical protein